MSTFEERDRWLWNARARFEAPGFKSTIERQGERELLRRMIETHHGEQRADAVRRMLEDAA